MISKSVSLGDKLELTKKSISKKNEKPLFSVVQEIVDKSSIMISAPIENGKIIPLELDKIYYLCIYTKRGLYRCEGVIINRIKSNNIYTIIFKIKTKMQKYQRRQYYRLDCVLSFKYKDDIDDHVWHEGTILDISGGGMRFNSKQSLELDSIIECNVQLNLKDENYHMHLNGKIVGSEIIDYDLKTYESRVEFENISIEDREVIIRFIFEEERRRRKNEKGLY